MDSVGFEHEFYADASAGQVDEVSLKAQEVRDVKLLSAIADGEDPAPKCGEVVAFITLLIARTKSLRSTFEGTARKGLDAVRHKLTSAEGAAHVTQIMNSRADSMSMEQLCSLVEAKGAVRRRLFEVGRKNLVQLIKTEMRNSGPDTIARYLAAMDRMDLPTQAARRGQIRAVNTLLDQEPVEHILRSARWSILSDPQSALVLGDACVVAVDGEGQPGPLARFGKDTSEVYLPISSSQALVGTINNTRTSRWLEPTALNHASASTSFENFFSGRCTESERQLCASVGTNAWWVSPDDMTKAIDEAL